MPGGPLITADGVPLKVSLRKSLRQRKLRALMLVAPPLLFLVFMFVIPIGSMLTRSVDDALINNVLPKTFAAFAQWDKVSEPPEMLFAALYEDLVGAGKTDIGKAGIRMNYAKPGWRSLVKRTVRELKNIDASPYKESLHKDRCTLGG